MRKGLKLVLSVLGTIIALVLAHFFNICDMLLQFVPVDNRYDVCVGIYFTVIEFAISEGYERVCKKIEEKKTDIELTFYKPKEDPDINNTPMLKFNKTGMSEVKMRVRIRGNCNNISDSTIKISAIKQADMQFAKKGPGVKINENGDALIALADICYGHENLIHEEVFDLVFQRGTYETGVRTMLEPEIQPKGKRVRFSFNKIKLVMEEQ